MTDGIANPRKEGGSQPGGDLVETVKEVHRAFPTGVTIVTVESDGRPYGLAVNAFSSVSLEPPVVLVCVAATSSTHPYLFREDHIGVNILAEDQTDVVSAFAKSGGDKFTGLAWSPGEVGCPTLDGSVAQLELKVEKRLQAYTHTILIGQVVAARVTSNPAMVYLDGGLFRSSSLTTESDE